MIFCAKDGERKDNEPDRLVRLFKTLMPERNIIDYYKLAHGRRHCNYVLTSDQGKILLRIKDKENGLASISLEKAIYDHLDGLIEHPHCMDHKVIDNRLCILYEYQEGEEIQSILDGEDEDAKQELMVRLGQDMAKIHQSKEFFNRGILDETLDIVSPAMPLFDWWEQHLEDRQLTERLGEGRVRFIRRVLVDHLELLKDIDQDYCLIHGDFNRQNILVGERKLIFLDWEFVSAGIRHCDIGHLFRGYSQDESYHSWFRKGYAEVLGDALDDGCWIRAKLCDLLSLTQTAIKEEIDLCMSTRVIEQIDHTLAELKL